MRWARLLKRVFHIHVERCARGGQFNIVGAIEEPVVIVSILTHLGLAARAPLAALAGHDVRDPSTGAAPPFSLPNLDAPAIWGQRIAVLPASQFPGPVDAAVGSAYADAIGPAVRSRIVAGKKVSAADYIATRDH